MAGELTKHRVRDISVRMLRGGRGPKLLFLHGAGGLPSWLPFFETIAAHYEVLIPEHPGFGTSDDPPWIRNTADLAMYYLDVLDELGADVHIVGHSLGGWLAGEIGIRNTAHVTSITVLNPAGVRVKGIPSGDNFIWSVEEAERNMFHDPALAEAALAAMPTEEDADIALTNRFMAAKFGWEPRWFNPALERWLHRIRIPTLIVWGENDKLFPSAYAKAWQAQIAGSRLELIPDCGHRPHIEKADLTAQKLLAFLGGVRR